MNDPNDETLITLTADIVAAHISNNSVSLIELPVLIANVHRAMVTLGSTGSIPEAREQPKVAVRSSIKPEYIVCLEDGRQMKMLKRHLKTDHNMTPDEYRRKWGLNTGYPMVAPNYAEKRRQLAKSIGLGTEEPKAEKRKKGSVRTSRRAASAKD